MLKHIRYLFLILLLVKGTVFGSENINLSLKINLIERISQFIQWPDKSDEFTIGVYGKESIKEKMIEIYKDKTIHRHKIKVLRIKDKNDSNISKLDLLYITKESSSKIDIMLKKINKLPILLITEYPDDVYSGLHLGFYYDKNKRIKFLINQKSLEKAGLKASYKLLRLAKIVEEKKND